MNAASLCSGVGGLDLGVGIPTSWFCEADKHCRTILERHWPGVPIVPDVREIDGGLPRVDLLHGGYPCQPFSSAGKRLGERDPRHLWPEFARSIGILRPGFVLLENVSGHLRLGFDRVLADLTDLGYDARWMVVRASDVGAPHRRERLFVLATDADGGGQPLNTKQDGRRPGMEARESSFGHDAVGRNLAPSDADGEQRQPRVGWGTEGGDHPRTGEEEQDGSGHDGSPEHRPITTTPSDTTGAEWGGAELESVGAPAGAATEHRERPGEDSLSGETDWGAFGPAVRRWESIVGPAPRPTDDQGRMNPEFVEWMMGFRIGWTEGLSRTQRLKMLGNAVVPQQCALAIRLLTTVL